MRKKMAHNTKTNGEEPKDGSKDIHKNGHEDRITPLVENILMHNSKWEYVKN